MKKLLFIVGILLSLSAFSSSTNEQPMPADEAFVFSAKLFGSDTIVLNWEIAPGHYLYRDRMAFKIIKPTTASIGTILLPPGITKEDQIFGKYQVYADNVTIPIPIIKADPKNTILQVTYQGCAESGYCYPPVTHEVQVNFTGGAAQTNAPAPPPKLDQFSRLLASHHLVTILFAFIGFGILLSFTPCVLPMIPIISGIIVGHQKTITTGKAFRLTLVYVLSMSITYAIVGILVGYLGGNIQIWFQKPWVLIVFSLLFVALALSFFGLYQLKLPAHFEERIANISRHQRSGHYLGVAIMGCLATLIVSPCVTPALVGVLGYIGKTGNAVLGGTALFALGLGMGLPILLIGTAGGKILPKAGTWMKTVESVFGVLFIGIAIWMLDRIIPSQASMLLWSGLFIISAVYMGALSSTPPHGWGKLWKGLGVVMLAYGILLIIGVAQGNDNPLQPLTNIGTASEITQPAANVPLFTRVKNLDEVKKAVAQAKSQNKMAVLDFYADWCVACQEMEHTTFSDPTVRSALSRFVALQADVTANNEDDKALMQYFNVIAPPTIVFFDTKGQPLKDLTIIGKMDTKDFLNHLQQALQP